MGDRVAATFVFTDLVGSTELNARLDAETADMLRQRHFGLLRAAVEDAGGREVKNLGDGLMAVFPSPSRALAAAVAMQQAVDSHNRGGGERLGIRVGVATGEATEEAGDFFGDPVVEAARLCAIAGGGQILTTDLVRLTLGRHATHALTPLGQMDLKGLPDPVPVVEVGWEPISTGAEPTRPIPGRLEGRGPFGFSGRTVELAAVADARKAAGVDRRLQVVLIAGEPGMGKSSLAAAAARAAYEDGATVLFGECIEGSRAPYQPWLSALSQLLRGGSAEWWTDLVPVYAGALRRLLPADAARLPPGEAVEADPDTERLLLMQSVAALLERADAEAPVVVVLDDLHWADAASLALLRHLLGSPGPWALTILVTYRHSDLGPDDPLPELLADLHRQPAVQRIMLDGLADTEIVELMQTAAGYELDEEAVALAHALRRETGGNPFFVAELLRHLTESGAITQDPAGRYVLAGDLEDLSLPPSVLDVIARRVQRLGPDAMPVLSAAAVIGREFDLEVLEEVADVRGDALLDLLERGAAATLLSETTIPGRYRFTHALVQHSLARGLSATRRQRVHLRTAEVLESREAVYGGDIAWLAELARHWQAATRPADAAKAIEYARRAGDAALEALSPVDAAHWFAQALELAGREAANERERFALLLRLISAQCAIDQAAALDTMRRAGRLAEHIGDPDLLVEWSLTGLRGWRTSEGADPEVLRLLHRALPAVPADQPATRARVLAALVDETDPAEWRVRRDLTATAMEVVATSGDDAATLEVLLTGAFLAGADLARDDVALRDHALHLAEQARNPVALAAALQGVHSARMVVGDVVAVDAAIERLRRLHRSVPLPVIECSAQTAEACEMMLRGDLPALEQVAERLLALGQAGFPSAYATYGGVMFELRWAQGRLAEFQVLFANALTDLAAYSGYRPALVLSSLAGGDVAAARRIFALDTEDSFQSFPRDVVWLPCMGLFAEAAIALDDAAAARALYELSSPYGELHAASGPIYYGLVDRSVGRLAAFLGRLDEGRERLEHALDVHRRLGARYWTAVTAMDLAEGIGRSSAAAWVDEAEALATEGGYAGVSRRVEQWRA